MKYKSLIRYVIFGVLTTAVNYTVYFPLFYIAGFTALLSNVLAWIAAVLFSFFTNKSIVFGSIDWSLKKVLFELTCFVGCRIATGAFESVILYLLVDVMQMSGVVWKLAVSVVVVILNYITSRIYVFRRK